jgi:hypothetical protein
MLHFLKDCDMRTVVGFVMNTDENAAVPVFGWDSESMGDAVARLVDLLGEIQDPDSLDWFEPQFSSTLGSHLGLVSVDVDYTFKRA